MALTDEEFNIKKACLVIKNYLKVCFTDEEIQEKFPVAAEQLIRNSKRLEKLRDGVGVKSQNQGDRSTTFNDGVEAWTITEDIKALLPNPINFKVW
ncbi:hypothetical protein FDC58_10685 [Clostridium botulinum]|uniref:hypothetical protein n=1 Tax=unclassified Clostridium TaxID=2614128 RepID=UPI000540EAD0|nr:MULTISPECIES: hypothetical protein [unclassified Clostridium]AIY80580.1 hypothetical protein U728_1664 [Clostridium botulinum 202F]KAI3344998.1 hypothetical protein CIT17_15395 [Clostridium botulinum]KON14084.1 N-acetylmuramoyl-L-alanine amidase [Clostridium botulinum]MBY6986415.1 hypothetical protein [Clostridium botulinum]MBY7009059.1 hypothetical protein [Clostridium botulinum]